VIAATVPADPAPHYVGLMTRAIAFVIDAALISFVGVMVGAGGSLAVSLLRLPESLRTALVAVGAALYVAFTVGYFVVFWSTTGQTPGDRIMRLRVVAADGGDLKPRRAFVRCIGLVLAALPLLAGYALILFDRRRRGLQDRLARTVVIETVQPMIIGRSSVLDDAAGSGGPEGGSTPVHLPI
jgi:uncharacterized RDD family membrane protein YckC